MLSETWRKSSRSAQPDGACVEARLGSEPGRPCAAVSVRDSKHPDGDRLGFGSGAWRSFLAFTTN